MNKCYITVKVFCFLSLCSMPIVNHNNEHVWTLYLTYLLDYITTSSDIKRFYWGVKEITVIIKEVWYDIWIIYKRTKDTYFRQMSFLIHIQIFHDKYLQLYSLFFKLFSVSYSYIFLILSWLLYFEHLVADPSTLLTIFQHKLLHRSNVLRW